MERMKELDTARSEEIGTEYRDRNEIAASVEITIGAVKNGT